MAVSAPKSNVIYNVVQRFQPVFRDEPFDIKVPELNREPLILKNPVLNHVKKPVILNDIQKIRTPITVTKMIIEDVDLSVPVISANPIAKPVVLFEPGTEDEVKDIPQAIPEPVPFEIAHPTPHSPFDKFPIDFIA
ncbi:MAG: hypothetical protein QF437_08980 [Planctomycetota bacterium]|jgi:hypothetical protein|nr:hypothetical protein [Planctomycetota bacterium]MDP7130609.1 hypothetical protein [Planctomycetota bacterium]MDP7251928.1 hypothetical protein [Planctomycetota bacterium]